MSEGTPTYRAKRPEGEFAKMAFHNPGNYGLMAGPNGPHVHLDGGARTFNAGSDKMLTFDTPFAAGEWARTHNMGGAVVTERRNDGGSVNFDGFAPLWSQSPNNAADHKVGVFRDAMRLGGKSGGAQ